MHRGARAFGGGSVWTRDVFVLSQQQGSYSTPQLIALVINLELNCHYAVPNPPPCPTSARRLGVPTKVRHPQFAYKATRRHRCRWSWSINGAPTGQGKLRPGNFYHTQQSRFPCEILACETTSLHVCRLHCMTNSRNPRTRPVSFVVPVTRKTATVWFAVEVRTEYKLYQVQQQSHWNGFGSPLSALDGTLRVTRCVSMTWRWTRWGLSVLEKGS